MGRQKKKIRWNQREGKRQNQTVAGARNSMRLGIFGNYNPEFLDWSDGNK